jgi:hypothetical protein
VSQPFDSEPGIYQRAENSQVRGGQQASIGDGNFQYQDNSRTININVSPASYTSFPPIELQRLSLGKKIINYIGALFFLTATLVCWSLIGLFASCEFPINQILILIQASFIGRRKGLDGLWQEIKNQYEEKANLSWQDLDVAAFNQKEYNRLNKLKSEDWLLEKLILIATSGARNKSQDIEEILDLLEKRAEYTRLSLTPLNKKLYPKLDVFQKIWTKVFEGYSRIEIDYKKIDQLLDSFVFKFTISPNTSSDDEVNNLLGQLRKTIAENPHNIDKARLKTLDSVCRLLEWASTQRAVEIDEDRRRKALELIIGQVRTALEKTTYISSDTFFRIEKGIRNQWLYIVSVYGFNGNGLSVIELALEIDWAKFSRARNLSGGVVKVSWNGDTAIEVDKAIEHFNSFVQKNYLTTEYRVSVSPGLDEVEIYRKLGFYPAPVTWDNNGMGLVREQVEDLAELGIGLYFAPRDKVQF